MGETSDMPRCWESVHVDITGSVRRERSRADAADVPLSAVAGTVIGASVHCCIRSYKLALEWNCLGILKELERNSALPLLGLRLC